jgi:hypothetical protein
MGRRHLPSWGPDHVRDDAGGVWIITGWVLGGLVYLGVLVAWHAGFTAAAPFVVIPAVLLVMVGAGNLLSGRRPGRPAPQFNRPDPIPLTTFRRDAGPPDGPHVPVPPAAPVDDAGEAADPGVGGGEPDR